ncbi:response regulator transcription factor [Kiritimatiellaeota bacterium B1221]|nr:response regulator transcription factor [Kiritimatiellaeota bacterium B1221]
MPRILLIEDDPHIADVVVFLLEEQGHRVDRATDGRIGWGLYQKGNYALVILDLGLPGMHGWELLPKIRDLQPAQALILLTALGEEPERVKGLTLGADDYITKPFSNPELVARVRNLLRRVPPLPELRVYGPIRLWPEKGEVTVNGVSLTLPLHEFRLLECLMSQVRQIFSRELLLLHMYGDELDVTDRAVDQAVKRLRKKIQRLVPDFDGIETVYGQGYRLREGN